MCKREIELIDFGDVIDLGDVGEETKQLAPGGPYWDSIYWNGWKQGLE
jgi:hypothetical protein